MREAKIIARFIMELILAISITIFLLIHILSKTLLNEPYILSSLQKADYYNKVYQLVESNFENYIQQSGLDEEVLKNIVTEDMIEKDTKTIISNIYNGFKEDVSIVEIEKKLENNIKKSLKNRSLSSEETKAIKEYVAKISEEYKATISNLQIEDQIYSKYKIIKEYANLGQKISVFAIGGSVIVLILLNLKRFYKLFTNLGISALASGSILTIINIYINSKIKVQNLLILNDAISEVIQNISKAILDNVLKYGLLFIIGGLGLIFVPTLIHYFNNYKNEENKPEEKS